MKPLPPLAATCRCLAEVSGSSGRGNGTRSMMTSRSEGPGTSTPCHSDSVPNRQVGSSSANCLTSSIVESSPWHSSGTSSRSRSASVAALAARIEENRPSVRPPAASISSAISSRYCCGSPSRPGWGRCLATYRMPARGWSNGEPTSMPCQPLPSPSPHCAASASNVPPSASVAEVSTTVRSPKSLSRSMPLTLSGATRSAGGRRSVPASSQTTSARSDSESWPYASSMRTAVSCTSSRALNAALRCPALSGSSLSALRGPMAVTQRQEVSRMSCSVSPSTWGSSSMRPGGAAASSALRSSPASMSWSARGWSISRPTRRTASITDDSDNSPVTTEVTRSTSSWASSTTTTSCSGSTGSSPMASMAISAWLVTTTSTSPARALASSAKHSAPEGQRLAPRHSWALTENCRQACSLTPGTSSSRSPVSVSSAHSWMRCTMRPVALTSRGSNSWSRSSSSGQPAVAL